MKKAKKWMTAAGVGLAVLMLIVVALPVAADTTMAAPVAHRSGPMGGGSDTYLAEALGITADELQAAQQAATEAAIDQALAQGLITQAQADALKERSGMSGRFDGRMPHGMFGLADDTIDRDALLADALGITSDELNAARSEAQDLSLVAAVEAGRITQEQADQMKAQQALQTYMQEQGFWDQVRSLYENFVQQAVQAGVITQEQADTILSNQDTFGGMRGFDSFHGRGGMRTPGMRGLQAPDSSSSSPSRYIQPPVVTGSDL